MMTQQETFITRADFIARIADALKVHNYGEVEALVSRYGAGHPVVAERAKAALVRERASGSAELIPAEGYYTVVLNGNESDYVTFCVERQSDKARFAPGKLLIHRLIGADNTRDYRAVALAPEVQYSMRIFKNELQDHRLVAALHALVAAPETAGQHYAMKSSRCRRCGRVLTVPHSLHNGYGPECARKIAGGG